MRKVLLRTIFLVLIPVIGFAAPKNKEAAPIMFQVISSKTQIHGRPPNVFSYTDVIFARVEGKNIIFVCDQRGDACPLMETGKTYSADRVGDFIYLMLGAPGEKRPSSIRYRQTGSW
jgi:hypothetical protein